MCRSCGFVSCGPNEALVISGCFHKKPLFIAGGRAFVWPVLQEVHRIPLNIMTLQVESPTVYTSQGVPISVTGIAQIKIQGQNEEMLHTACEQFLGKSEVEIANIALNTLEGHQRAIMGTMTVEEIYQDRLKFSTNVFEVASSDLVNMGITVVSYTLKDIRDEEGYLLSLGMTRTAEVKRDARIGEAEAKRDALIKQAAAEEERIAARLFNDIEIAKAKRDYELKKAEFDIEVQSKKAAADMAFDLQTAIARQKVVEEKIQVEVVERTQEIVLEEQELIRKKEELEYSVRLPAEAEKYRLEQLAEAERFQIVADAKAESEAIRLKGYAEAYALQAKAKAEAESMTKKADAWVEYKDAAVVDFVLQSLPKIISGIASPLSENNKITIVSSGSGDIGAAKLVEEIFTIVSRVPELIKALIGVDMSQLHLPTMRARIEKKE